MLNVLISFRVWGSTQIDGVVAQSLSSSPPIYASEGTSVAYLGAIVLGKLPVPGRPTIWIIVGQGPIALVVGADGGCLDIFTLLYRFSPFSLSLGDGPI